MRRIHLVRISLARLFVFALLTLAAAAPAHADKLEFTNGASLEGEVVGRDAQTVTLKIVLNGQTFTRKFPVERIKAVVTGDKREALQRTGESPRAALGTVPEAKPAQRTGDSPRAALGTVPDAKTQRTKAEVEALIEQQGRTAPDWWESTPLEYPQTLDLSWPQPAPGPWNAKKNIGQYLWEVIYPNSGKWHAGTRFVHYLLGYHKDSPEKQEMIMNTLGRMYFSLLEDYPRAAFWWRKAGVEKGDQFYASGVSLAESYWRMGSKEMALDLLKRTEVQFSTIKLLGDMGETQAALRLADASAQGAYADQALLCAGDACRMAGDLKRALDYYQKALVVPSSGRNKEQIDRLRRRAQANIEGIKAFGLLDLKRVPDGTYRSSSQGYEREVGVEVAVKGGRIESVRVVQHHEKQFYSSMIDTPRKIVAKQGVTGIDATSGATITSEAIVNATAKALSGAMKP